MKNLKYKKKYIKYKNKYIKYKKKILGGSMNIEPKEIPMYIYPEKIHNIDPRVDGPEITWKNNVATKFIVLFKQKLDNDDTKKLIADLAMQTNYNIYSPLLDWKNDESEIAKKSDIIFFKILYDNATIIMNKDPGGGRISSKPGSDHYYNKGLHHFAKGVISGKQHHTKEFTDNGGRNWWRKNIHYKVLELIGKSNNYFDNLIKKLGEATNEIIAGLHLTMFRLDFVKNNAVENIFDDVMEEEDNPLSEEEKNFLLKKWKRVWDESFWGGVKEVIKQEQEEILSSNETWNVMKLLGDTPKKNIEKRASERLNTLLKNIFSAGGREVFKMEEEDFINMVPDDFRQSWINKYIDKVGEVTKGIAYIIHELKEKMTAQNFTWEPLEDDKMVEKADSMLTEFVTKNPGFYQGLPKLQENWIKVVAHDWHRVFNQAYNEMVRVRGNIKSGVEAQLEAQRIAADKAAKEQELKKRRAEAEKRRKILDAKEAAHKANYEKEKEERRAREEEEKEAERQAAAMKAQAEKDKKDRINAAQKQYYEQIQYIKEGLLNRFSPPDKILDYAKIFSNGTAATPWDLGMEDESEKIFKNHLKDVIRLGWGGTPSEKAIDEEVMRFNTNEVLKEWQGHYENAVREQEAKLRMKSPMEIEAEEREKEKKKTEEQKRINFARHAKEAAALGPGPGAPHGYSVFTGKPLPESRRQIWDARAADRRAYKDNIARGVPDRSDYVVYHPDGTPMTAKERFQFDQEWKAQGEAAEKEDRERAVAWKEYQKKLTQNNSTNESNDEMTQDVSYGAVPTGPVQQSAQSWTPQAAQQQPSWTQQSPQSWTQPHTNMLGDVESPNPQKVWGELGYDPNKGPQYLQLGEQQQQPAQSQQPQQLQQLPTTALENSGSDDWGQKLRGQDEYRDTNADVADAHWKDATDKIHNDMSKMTKPFLLTSEYVLPAKCGECLNGWIKTEETNQYGQRIWQLCGRCRTLGKNTAAAREKNDEDKAAKEQALEEDLELYFGSKIKCPTCDGTGSVSYNKTPCNACNSTGEVTQVDPNTGRSYVDQYGRFMSHLKKPCPSCTRTIPCPTCDGAGVSDPLPLTDAQQALLKKTGEFTRHKKKK